jgi:peptide chain release factor subunit 3
VNVVFIGHVDHGKSTMSGAILLASNMVDKREVQKLQADAEAEGRESWWKAFLMDTNPEERAKVRLLLRCCSSKELGQNSRNGSFPF